MERRNRNILVVLIGIVITVAMLSSFGLGLFAPDTAKIQLPAPAASQSQAPVGEDEYVRVEITTETVQYVVEHTLTRPESYGRTVTIEDFWGEGQSGVTRATVWVDGGWTHTTATLPGGAVRHSIVGDGQFWLWYEGNSRVLTGSADENSADLEGQRIPTYEDVLQLKQSEIADAGYEDKEGVSCIFVETVPDSQGYAERYWISTDSGLLSCAETRLEGQLIYRMSAFSVDRPVPENASFALPDGTVLHDPS
ncbi:MAG: hypothetical protein MSB10_03275 [Clostridiales bacterium]|uniref:hypothetical protein n=1 Tax=Flavonifractor porci TaxID=3133422 RepID=UPI0030A88B9D|nr:hypothetical protein [Clostridiales bacterium]